DALWQNTSRNALADQWKNIIVKELKVLKKRHSLLQLIKRIFLFILVLAIQYGFYLIITRLYKKLKNYIIRIKGQKLKPIKIKDYELLNVNKVARMLIFSANMGRYLLIAVQLIITIPILFSIFPQTENLALRIFSYLWNPVRSILLSIRHYIPNFFTIIVIIVSIRFLIRGIKYLTSEIETQRLKIDGFYPDWAQPTYHIIRFLLYAFMVAMIYPYLPGSDTRVFQGISVFVGLIVSLGSSTVISNIIAGMVITYMRPFKLGDRIKLNDVLGNVTEKTPFVTRLKTPKNEIVTIPNSFVMSSHTTNYTASARTYGLIIHTEVTIGYDAPWRQVNQLLIDAALDTPGIEKEPIPFVLETSLNDWYPVYQINAFIKEADQQAHIMTLLLQSIQDHFNKAGVEIMSPTYIATRDGNQSTIPKGAGFPENITK
ncbi:MAG: mechanosensitive ion channel, partial [Bacteroidales bacterium]